MFEFTPNFRDIGGLVNNDGRMVRQGCVYRSAMPQHYSSEDLRRLRELNISLVFDLRSPTEREQRPHTWTTDEVRVRAPDSGDDLSAVKVSQWRERLLNPQFDAAAAHWALIDNYQRMPASFAGELARIYEHLATAPTRPILVHCSIGKDRTGFVIATLLKSLGVAHEVVLQDYLLSAQRLASQSASVNRFQNELFGELPEHAGPALRTMLGTHPDYLQSAFDRIDEQYGSFRGYLSEQVGLDDSRLARVKSHLLMPSTGV